MVYLRIYMLWIHYYMDNDNANASKNANPRAWHSYSPIKPPIRKQTICAIMSSITSTESFLPLRFSIMVPCILPVFPLLRLRGPRSWLIFGTHRRRWDAHTERNDTGRGRQQTRVCEPGGSVPQNGSRSSQRKPAMLQRSGARAVKQARGIREISNFETYRALAFAPTSLTTYRSLGSPRDTPFSPFGSALAFRDSWDVKITKRERISQSLLARMPDDSSDSHVKLVSTMIAFNVLTDTRMGKRWQRSSLNLPVRLILG